MWAVAAALFAAATLICVHVAAVAELTRFLPLAEATAIVAGADLIIAGTAALLAARDVPCAQERKALALRQEAIGGIRRDFAWVMCLPTLIAMVRRFL